MTLLAAILFLTLIALDLLRDRLPDPWPVLSHPRLLLAAPAAAIAAAALLDDAPAFLLSCAAFGALAALLTERFRLTQRGIECRGAVLEWRMLEPLRRTPLFIEVRTTRGQRVRFPRWMDGLQTLTRAAERSRLQPWSRRAGSSS